MVPMGSMEPINARPSEPDHAAEVSRLFAKVRRETHPVSAGAALPRRRSPVLSTHRLPDLYGSSRDLAGPAPVNCPYRVDHYPHLRRHQSTGQARSGSGSGCSHHLPKDYRTRIGGRASFG